jgi:hypothetical protein
MRPSRQHSATREPIGRMDHPINRSCFPKRQFRNDPLEGEGSDSVRLRDAVDRAMVAMLESYREADGSSQCRGLLSISASLYVT